MSSWNYNAPQYVDFNKLPKEENIDSYFDLDHENNEVNELSNALNASKLSDDHHSIDSDQPVTSALQDKTNKMVDTQSSDGESILANLCGSQKEWNNKAKVAIIATKPSRSRPLVARIKSKGFRQSSPCRSPLAKRICPTSNPMRPTSGQRKVFARSKSAASIHKVRATQMMSQLCNDDQLEAAERSSLRSSMEPLSSLERGRQLLCSERSHSLPSVHQLDQNCSELSSTESNPVSRSQTDLDRNSKLDSSNESIPSGAKVGNQNFSHADKVCHGYVTGGSASKSSEQLEFEKMEQLKKDLERKRKIAKMSMVKALAVPNQPVIHSTRQTTKPVEFHFATDNRFKEPTKAKSGPLNQDKDFAMQLRQPEPPLQRPRGLLTVIQPFNLSDDKKRKREDPTEAKPEGYKFQTMGEKLLQFCSKTPERFRRKKEQTDPPSPHAAVVRPRMTVAKTPNLTKTRHRKVDALSREQQEELEVQEMKKHQFKALPLNKKILDQRDHLKPIPAKPRTTFEPFKLTSVMRRSEGNLSSSEETRHEFHAQPIPKSVFEPDVIKKEVFKCTIPQSPAFSWKKNPRASRVSESNLAKLVREELMFKAPPVPKFDDPFQPVLPHRHTEPQPFHFEERMKEAIAKKEKTFQMVLEEEAKAREFVANPIPDLSPVLPKRKTIPVTDPVPFHFLVDERGADKAKKFEEKLEEEERKSREAATFRAQPVTVLYRDPFVPQKVEHPAIESEPFRFQTEERNVQRQQWTMWKKEKEEEEEVQRQERERQRLEEEEAEVQQQRRETVHRANPIRRYKPLEAMELLPLTDPQSPDFSERLKPRK